MEKPKLSIIAPAIAEDEQKKIIAVDADGQAAKAALLEQSVVVKSVTTVTERDQVIALTQSIDSHLILAESERVKWGKPYHETWKAINAVIATHVAALESEKRRLNLLTGNFEVKRLAAEDEERRKIAAEAARVAKEAAAKANEAAAAIADTQQSSAPAALSLEAELEAETAADIAEAAQRKAEDEAILLAESQRQTKPTGGGVRYDYEVTVTDIELLRSKKPECVKMVADMVQLKFLAAREVELPGCSVKKTPRFQTRKK